MIAGQRPRSPGSLTECQALRKKSLDKTIRKLGRKRDILAQYLAAKRIEIEDPNDFAQVYGAARDCLAAYHLKETYNTTHGFHSAFNSLIQRIGQDNFQCHSGIGLK